MIFYSKRLEFLQTYSQKKLFRVIPEYNELAKKNMEREIKTLEKKVGSFWFFQRWAASLILKAASISDFPFQVSDIFLVLFAMLMFWVWQTDFGAKPFGNFGSWLGIGETTEIVDVNDLTDMD